MFKRFSIFLLFVINLVFRIRIKKRTAKTGKPLSHKTFDTVDWRQIEEEIYRKEILVVTVKIHLFSCTISNLILIIETNHLVISEYGNFFKVYVLTDQNMQQNIDFNRKFCVKQRCTSMMGMKEALSDLNVIVNNMVLYIFIRILGLNLRLHTFVFGIFFQKVYFELCFS